MADNQETESATDRGDFSLKGAAMKTRISGLGMSCSLGGGILLALLMVGAVALTGCQRPLEPGETYHKVAVAWPIFDTETTEGIDANGVHWKKVKGDAAIWLASWEKLHKFNKQETRIYRKERKTFIPFYSVNVEESPEFRKTWGIILLYPYSSYRLNTAEGAVPPPTMKDK